MYRLAISLISIIRKVAPFYKWGVELEWRFQLPISRSGCSCISLFLLLLSSCTTAVPGIKDEVITPETYEEAAALYNRAHSLFIARSHDRAIEAYAGVDRFIEKYPRYGDFFDHHYRGFSMADMVRRHRALGDAEPMAVHRVLVIFIERTEAIFGDRPLFARVTEEMKETGRISRQVCALLLEVLSDGKLGLEFEEISIDAALRELEASDPRDSRSPADLAVESLSPYPGEELASRMAEFDSFVYYWNHLNGEGETIYQGPHGWGGVSRIPLIPYRSYGLPRGRILISAGLIDRPGTLLHELIHTFEKAMGIDPIHGFQAEHRHHFPGWKGKLDYYQFHLSLLAEDPGYGNFLLSRRYPGPEWTDSRKDDMHGSDMTPLADRRESFLLSAQAGQMGDTLSAMTLYRKALDLHPENGPAHLGISVIFHQKKEREQALFHAKEASRIDPFSAEAAYWLGVCHYNSGSSNLALEAMERAMELDPAMEKARIYYNFVRSSLEK